MVRYAIATLLVPVLIGAAPPVERVVDGDHIVSLRINGVAMRLRVDPAAPSIALVTPEAAERAHLRIGRRLGIGFGYGVGPVTVISSTAVARADFGQGEVKTRVAWASRPFSAVADGTIGPAALPDTVVTVALRAPNANDRTVTLRYDQPGFPMTIFGIGWSYATGEIDLDGQPLNIRFAPNAPRTLATAGAAARLAKAYDGILSGDPASTDIAFGVARPVRTLTLARPLMLGSLAIGTLGARVSDDGNGMTIREAGAPPSRVDPDEVVVTAKGKKRDVRRDTLSIGADLLGRCSSIVFDKPAHQIRLRCA
ncbi:hypothetical protein JW805_00530 [Roseomonas aeriglobus]|nr:hypothetical protein [Roseomonas aeriglobus]